MRDDVAQKVNADQLARLLGDWRQGTAYMDLAQALKALILDGRLSVAARIPAERTLAASWGISRNTVASAYQRLREEGYLRSRQGAGSYAALPDGAERAPRALSWVPGQAVDTHIDLTCASLPAPEPAFSLAVAETATRMARHSDGHGYDLVGLPALRQAIADHYTARGVRTNADQIMVTVGAHHAWGLLLRLLVRPREPVLIDSPTYPNALEAIRSHGARPMPVGLDDAGWDVDLIESAVRGTRPAVAYLMPDFHNPTGLVMPDATRRAVVDAALHSGTYVVVDETLSEVNLDAGPLPPPMAAYGRSGAVISIGSLSKTVWAGLRVGWVRASKSVISRLVAVRGPSDPGNPLVQQLIACRLFETYDDLLRARSEELVAQRTALTDVLRAQLPQWRFTVPRGGLCLWVDLGAQLSTKLSLAAGRHGVQLLPGPRFGADGTLENRLRLPFALDATTLATGVARLREAFDEVTAEQTTPPRPWTRTRIPAPHLPATRVNPTERLPR